LLTCISLLLSQGPKGPVLQSSDLELEELEIDARPSPVVVTLGFRYLGARDLEDRHSAAVRAPEQDVHELAAPREREATEKEIIGL
jgi:hypothetical protein